MDGTNRSAGLITLAGGVHAFIGEGGGLEDFAKAVARRVLEEPEADSRLAVHGPNPPENIEPENSRRAPALGPARMTLDTGDDAFTFTARSGVYEQFAQSRAPVYGMEFVRCAVPGPDPLA